MSHALQLVSSPQGITLRTDTGFCLAQGGCQLQTSRGTCLPAELDPAVAPRLGLKHQWHVNRLNEQAIELWQSVQNQGSDPLHITHVRTLQATLQLQGAGWSAMHSELFRSDRYFEGFNHFTGGLLAAIPGLEGQFGTSEDFPFPAMLFTHPERGTVLMGALSQERCKPLWTLTRRNADTELTATDFFWGVPHLTVAPGRTLETERWVVLAVPGDVHAAIDAYYQHLRQRMTFFGTNSILREAILWGSWNYNARQRGMWDISHEYIAANARALSQRVPNRPRFVMVDDGYQRGRSAISDAKTWFSSWMEVVYPNPEAAEDRTTFPHGMKGLSDAIRAGGADPAVWVTHRVLRQSALALERPDWIVQLQGDRSFGARSAFLDYSVPEARQFIMKAWEMVTRQWGFKGIKLDFWSIPFEVPHVVYRNTDRTAVELRNQFLADLRSFIPAGGYIIAAVPVNSGSPFVGRYVDAVRMGIDVGVGHWSNILDSAWSLTGIVPFFRHDCLLGDADSVGYSPAATPGQNRLWATLAGLSGGICEIAGDLTNLSPEADALLRTTTDHFGPRRRTLLDLAPGTGGVPATRLRLQTDRGEYEGLLNWSSQGRLLSTAPGRDLWTGTDVAGIHKLAGHDAALVQR